MEKELGLKSKKDIEKYGIAEFNKKCRESVWKFKDEWERLTERMGFWLDMKDPYITYEKDYMETLWWIVAQFWKKKLLYKGHKIVNWCTRCGTGLSSHEMAQGYKEVVDNSVYVKFKLKKGQKIGKDFSVNDKTFILSWTTTPWTLPGNVALAVGEKIDYVFSKQENGEIFILAKQRFEALELAGPHEKVFKGSDLVGLSYTPLFEAEPLKSKNSYKIYRADFVTTTDGTGVVHTAVMYGEDDYKLGVKLGLPQHHTVDEIGKFTKDVKVLQGMYVKGSETEKKILDYLTKNNNLLKTESYKHEYPHCWRCSTPLLYYARSSWFVAMAKLRKELLNSNEAINWIPEHVKNGRFGEWLRDVKDWNFSRERYWGTPLPVWECKKCGHTDVVEGLEDLKSRTFMRNEFVFVRHGEATSNVDDRCASRDTKQYTSKLTSKGEKQVQGTAKKLVKEKIDLIISSNLFRAKQTAVILNKVLGVKSFIETDLVDINSGIFEGKKDSREYRDYFSKNKFDRFETGAPKGENWNQVRERMMKVFEKINQKYKGKKILIVSHADPLWLLKGGLEGKSNQEILKMDYPGLGSIYPIDYRSVPRGDDYQVDLHRPYVDEVVLKCEKCKGEMKRVKELCDVWFDSGSMPFASAQDKKLNIKNKSLGLGYPADYISEAVDQTRGWFYTLLAVATALGKGAPYKNVICLGHINDKFGQKMSKSKGNIVDPWAMAEKYGMDAVRWYMYSATPPGEPKNFDELELAKTYRRFHLILWNSLLFYKTYADQHADGKRGSSRGKPANVLDQWILARLEETKNKATKSFDKYQVREVTQEIERLTDDLSRWYIRRSRRRLQKSENKKDYEDCSQTLRFVLAEILKMAAPFNPFFSEILWSVLGEKDSVHLEEWPTVTKKLDVGSKKLIQEMEAVRNLAAVGLAMRAQHGVKVRQPLLSMEIGSKLPSKQLLEILADEVNVKKFVHTPRLKDNEVVLDISITPELKEEGLVRDLVRAVQELRQKANLSPNDAIVVMLECGEGLREIVVKNETFFKKEVGAKEILYKKSEKFDAESEVKIDEQGIWVRLRRV